MNESYKFSKENRYLTRGIQEHIPMEVQAFLWGLIDVKVKLGEQLDYLQIFKFETDEKHLYIVHSQEESQREEKYSLELKKGYEEMQNVKIYILDDKTHATMLLAEEY